MKKIKVLGSGCAKCNKLYTMVEEAAASLGIEIDLEKVEDINEIVDYGVMLTPGLVVDGEVKVSGRVPNADQLKALLQ